MCHPGVKARRATLLEKAIDRCFHRAGGHSTRQPSLYDLFGGYFKKEDLCALFPRSMTKTEADKRKRLISEYLEILLRYEGRSARQYVKRSFLHDPLDMKIKKIRWFGSISSW